MILGGAAIQWMRENRFPSWRCGRRRQKQPRRCAARK